jgi:hypothetical protein
MSFESSHHSPEEDHAKLFISLTDEDYSEKIGWLLSDGVASWAKQVMERPGHVILAKHPYLEKMDDTFHKVLWVEHAKFNDYGQKEHQEHLAVCDCSGDSGSEEMLFCGIYEHALHERAMLVARDHHIPDILSTYRDLEVADYQKREELEDFLLGTVEKLLQIDRSRPESWVGNSKSGEHSVNLLSDILDQPEDTVRLCAEILQWQGKVKVEDDVLRLAA